MSRDQEVCEDSEDGQTINTTEEEGRQQASVPASCKSPAYHIISFTDMIDQDKQDILMSNEDSEAFHETENPSTQKNVYEQLSISTPFQSCLYSNNQTQKCEMASRNSTNSDKVGPGVAQQSRFPSQSTSVFKESEQQQQQLQQQQQPVAASGLLSTFQPKDFTLNESINTQCFKAAVAEQMNCKITRLKYGGLRMEADPTKPRTLSQYKHLSLPHLKQIYLSAQARLQQRRQENAEAGAQSTSSLKQMLIDDNVLDSRSVSSQNSDSDNAQGSQSSAIRPSSFRFLQTAVTLHASENGNSTSTDSNMISQNTMLGRNMTSTDCNIISHQGSPSHSSFAASPSQSSVNSDDPGPHIPSDRLGKDRLELPTKVPSPHSSHSAKNSNSGASSPYKMKASSPKSNPEMKKYRYNQTALALQQSGLMKTTIKTAELLRKSQLLQKELAKLKKETSTFVSAVLNNPENQHVKEHYSRLFSAGQMDVMSD